MKKRERNHIEHNLSELVNTTNWNTSCITVPKETGVFGDDDISSLESVPDKRMRVLKFYELFKTKHNSFQHLITTLEKGCQSGAIEILNRLNDDDNTSSSDPEQQPTPGTSCRIDKNGQKVPTLRAGTSRDQRLTSPVRFDVYDPVRLFTGRLKELESLHEKLQQDKAKPTVISQMASIVGLGGIGKTELARMYIQKYAFEFYDNNVIWIQAETEGTLLESIQRLATDCLKLSLKNVDGKDKHIHSIIDDVYKFFEDRKCLFVFDNAESNDYIQKFMPFRVPDRPHILITSRDKEWQFSVEMLAIHEMEESEAIEFVKKGLEIEDDSQDHIVSQLVQVLQCFPLALSQAISYIKQQQMLDDYTICQYLKQFKSCSEKVLGYKLSWAEFNSYTKTTLTTWTISIETISEREYGAEAISLLNMISYFEPDRIPKALLLSHKNNKSTTPQQEANQAALLLLVKYSMINVQRREQTFTIHRLVQEVIRIELRRNKMEENTLDGALCLFSENINGDYIRHFSSVFKYSGDYKTLVVDYSHVSVFMIYDFALVKLNFNSSSLKIGIEMKEVLQKHMSSDNHDLLLIESSIANMNISLGNSASGVKSMNEILQNVNKESDEDDLDSLRINIAFGLLQLERPKESLKIILQVYKTVKARLGLDHIKSIYLLIGTANCLERLGHFEKPLPSNVDYMQFLIDDFNSFTDPLEVIALLKAVYENNKQLVGTYDIYTHALFSIASILHRINDNDTASSIARNVYEQGKNSNDSKGQFYSMLCLNLLGEIKHKQEKHEEAYQIFKEAHSYWSHTREKNNILTLASKIMMLYSFYYMDQPRETLKGFQDFLTALDGKFPNLDLVNGVKEEISPMLAEVAWYDESLEMLANLQTHLQEKFGQIDPLWSEVNKRIEQIMHQAESLEDKS